MATLREMLVKIYQPNQGIIEFGPGGQSTQDGNDTMAVLGGTPGQSDGAQQGGGAINMPAFRYAGADGGGGGGGGLDLSGIDWNDPQQAEMARRWLEREGGQGGEPGGAGAGGIAPGDPNAFVDPTLAQWTGRLAPFPLSLVGSLGAAGMRAHNAGLLDEAAMAAGGTGLSGWQMAGAALGPTFGNEYGEYGYEDTANALRAAGAGRAGGTGGLGPGAGGWVDSVVGLGPRDSGNRTGSWAGGLDTGSSSYDGAMGRSAVARRGQGAMRDDPYGGGSYGGGGAGGGGGGADQGHGGGGQLGGDRDRGFGGPRHQGGPVYGMPGEEVDHTLLAGEYVMSPEAVNMVGPDNLGRMNSLARMMGKQHYPAR